jgi:hypothetical protein
MGPVALVASIAVGVGLVQAAVWIPLVRHWNKSAAIFFADLEKQMQASGEKMLKPAERGSYEGATDVYGMVRGTGKILLTDRRLIFRKLTGGLVEIPIAKLRSARFSGSFIGSSVAGSRFLVIATSDPAEVGFTVIDSRGWKNAVESVVAGAATS